jgi:hypothetical protein
VITSALLLGALGSVASLSAILKQGNYNRKIRLFEFRITIERDILHVYFSGAAGRLLHINGNFT